MIFVPILAGLAGCGLGVKQLARIVGLDTLKSWRTKEGREAHNYLSPSQEQEMFLTGILTGMSATIVVFSTIFAFVGWPPLGILLH